VSRNSETKKPTESGWPVWSRGYCVSTVGLDEAMIREYIRVLLKSDDVKWAEGPPSMALGAKIAVIGGDLKKAEPFTGWGVGNRLR
jgi:hypothetical protein